ncbi:MAG: type I secretion C-terminal target domain-containing protein [Burkholderiales bacterium]|nr:MAG: type I secretion C-terminal target domain-containing protein [Burkholderiales bacterium]
MACARLTLIVPGMNMVAVLDTVQAALGPNVSRAQAITQVWDYIDDQYSTPLDASGYYKNLLNEASARLAVEYGKYLKAGGMPLLDVVAKYTPDGNDIGTNPDRLQSLHDNLLGNAHGPSLIDKMLGAGHGSNPEPIPATYQAILDLLAANGLSGLLARPIYDGYEASTNQALAWDLDNLLNRASGQIMVTDVDQSGGFSFSADRTTGTYGDLVLNAATGAWSYAADPARIVALGQGQTATESFTITVTDEKGGFDTITITVAATGVNDAPVLSAPAPINYFDTAVTDDFQTVYGSVVGTDPDVGDSKIYSIRSSAPDSTLPGYDLSKSGTYGTLYINSSNGHYAYVPNDAAVNGLKTTQTEEFILRVRDEWRAFSNEQTLVVTLNGANDAPVLSAPTPISYIDTAADDIFGNQSGTLAASDVDHLETLTYGIQGGANGAYVVGASSFDVRLGGAYGALYVNSGTGAYVHVPNDAAIEALNSSAVETFNVTVRDSANETRSAPLAINITAAPEGTPNITWLGIPPEENNLPKKGDVIANLTAASGNTMSGFVFSLAGGSDTDKFQVSAAGVVTKIGGAIAANEVYTLTIQAVNAGVTITETFEIRTADGSINSPFPSGGALDSALAGDDILYALGHGDTVYGGAGDDNIFGQAEADTLYGGSGNDRVFGGSHNDTLYGEGGDDWLDGGTENDILWGGAGNDTLHGGTHSDTLHGGDDNDTLFGDSESDYLYGDNGDDTLFGGSHADYLDGGTGNDILDGGTEQDTLIGGAGNDILTGGSHADVFKFAESGSANKDTITDYVFGDGDKVDLSALLDTAYSVGNPIGGFVRVVNNGGTTLTIQVDTDGAGTNAEWSDVADLTGNNTAGHDPVRVFFEGVDITITD